MLQNKVGPFHHYRLPLFITSCKQNMCIHKTSNNQRPH